MQYEEYEKIHTLENRIIVDTINLDKVGKVFICIYKNENEIPHFHIENKKKSFNCTLCIYEPRYCMDFGSFHSLDKEQLLLVYHFLNSRYRNTECTNWQHIASLWNRYNSKSDINSDKPNYLSLLDDNYSEIHSRENEGFIFTIYIDELGNLNVRVYQDEAKDVIPHFHLENDNKSFECCIGIYEPVYFNHEEIKCVLTDNQAKQLDKILREKSCLYPYNKSNWDEINSLWYTRYLCEKTTDIPKNVQPDYTQMENYTRE